MNPSRLSIYSTILLSLLVVSCGGSRTAATNRPFNVVLHATSDDGEPVEGVTFTTGTTRIGDSNSKGTATAIVRGFEGQSIPVGVRCPDGYVGPEQPVSLRLAEVRQVNTNAQSSLGIDATCIRKLRDIVVVVRTNNAPSLPVDVGGKTVGATDASGNAHVWLQVDRDVRSLSVSLGTSEAPAIRPQNPTRVFELDGRDALVLLDQTFTTDRRVAINRRATAVQTPKKRIPYRIGSGR